MVSPVWAAVAFFGGVLLYIGGAALGPALAMDLRLWLGRWHYKQWMRSFGECAIVWRLLGGPSIKPISVDDETKTAEVVLSSGALSEDQTLPFRDPDDRIYRLHKKPLAVIPEAMPTAVDAEVAEVGAAREAKRKGEGIVTHDGGETRVDPFVPVPSGLRAVNPVDALHLAVKSTEPEFIKTAKMMTEAKYEKYGSGIGAKETASVLVSFAVGAGVVMGAVYLRTEVMGEGGGGGTGGTVPFPPGMIDMGVQALGVLA